MYYIVNHRFILREKLCKFPALSPIIADKLLVLIPNYYY